MRSFKASAVQTSAGTDKEANLAAAAELVTSAAAAGAIRVALPEVFAWRGPQEREPEVAEPLAGRIGTFASELARTAWNLARGGLHPRNRRGQRHSRRSLLQHHRAFLP